MKLINRRKWLQEVGLGIGGLGIGGIGMSGSLPAAARASADSPRRHCILLWMAGGASQIDTFDMKPEHENGGVFKEISTKVPGVRFSEHLPRLAALADELAIVRSLCTKEDDHARATYMMQTGRAPGGAIQYPSLPAALAKEMCEASDTLPNYVRIVPSRMSRGIAAGAGYLGPRYEPLVVNAAKTASTDEGPVELEVESSRTSPEVGSERMKRRMKLWRQMEDRFLEDHPGSAPRAHQAVYQNAGRLMTSDAAKAFDLSGESGKTREKYGLGSFGQGCLMARRLIERGVSAVEVSLGGSKAACLGWDTHADNFATVARLSAELDAGWASLLEDLQTRGLLESTTILWLGEFGRTPVINGNGGRDHFPAAWSCVFAGGGIAGGQTFGKTSCDGMRVEEGKVGVGDILATLCSATGVAPGRKNISNTDRPVAIIEGKPIQALLT